MVDRLLQRHGTAEAALAFMASQAITQEDTIEQRDRTISELRAKVPAEGAVVLPKAEAEALAKLKALGTVDEIVAGMKERGDLKTTVSRTEAERTARTAAKASGLDEDAFVAHALRESLHIEMRDTQVEDAGKTVTKKLPFVRPGADATAPLKAIAEYTGALPAHDQRALKAAATSPAGVPYVEQGLTPITGSSGDPTAAFIAKQSDRAKARPNPLFPARQPTQSPGQQPAGATP